MPASIFSETELARLASFPEEIPGDDLIRAFTLTGADRDLVAIRRGAANRLGLALQLCALRYLGFVPRNLSAAPQSAACFVADHANSMPHSPSSVPVRPNQWFHFSLSVPSSRTLFLSFSGHTAVEFLESRCATATKCRQHPSCPGRGSFHCPVFGSKRTRYCGGRSLCFVM